MKTRNLSFLEKLPVYFVAYSVLLFFIILGLISLGLYPFSDIMIAAFKQKFLFIAVSVGTFLGVSGFIVNLFKNKDKAHLFNLAEVLLSPLAYFAFYFGVSRIIVVGICLVGITLSIFSILKVKEDLSKPLFGKNMII